MTLRFVGDSVDGCMADIRRARRSGREDGRGSERSTGPPEVSAAAADGKVASSDDAADGDGMANGGNWLDNSGDCTSDWDGRKDGRG